MKLGNGLWETSQVNERFQLTQVGLGTTATNNSLFKIDYEYGEVSSDHTSVDTGKNVGMIARTTTTIPSTSFVQTYKYDAIARLTEAKEKTGSTTNWQQTFGYDIFGNRTSFSQTVGTTTLPTNSFTKPTIDTENNRFTTGQGYVYDLNGNLIQDAEGRTFTFDGNDKQTIVRDLNIPTTPQTPDVNVIGRYYYDASGARVKKVTNTETTVFIYDAAGALAAEYSTQVETANPQESYLTTDHLGSPRVITDKSGNVVSRRDFMPFGEEIGAGVGTRSSELKYSASGFDNIRKRFTGYEKDLETGLDFAEARMYQNKHGRFTAVDPLMSSASPGDPQTFNRYSYTGNNPINRTDPSGLDWCRKQGSGEQNTGWVNGACNDGYDTVNNLVLTLAKGTMKATNGTAKANDQLLFNANGTVTITNARVAAPSAHVEVAATANDVQSDSAWNRASTNTSISPQPQLALPPCPPGGGCVNVSTPSAPSLEIGASADEVLDATQYVLEGIGLVPGLEVADLASGAISGLRGDKAGMILSAGAILPVGGQAFTGIKWAQRLEKARELGKAGELAAGITEAKKAIEVGGRKLFPDAVDDVAGVVTEVKNVGKQSYTRQLREYSKYAQSRPEKMDFVLFTRSDTALSGPLKKEISSGNIIHRCFDGPCKQF